MSRVFIPDNEGGGTWETWKDDRISVSLEDARRAVHYKAQAEALAEALRDIRNAYQKMFDVMPVAWQTYDHIAEQALEAYEKGAR